MEKLINGNISKKFDKQLFNFLLDYFNINDKEGEFKECYLIDKIQDNNTTEMDELEGQCGAWVIHDLCNESVEKQIAALWRAFYSKSQVIISDVITSSNWIETKAVSYHGPITINPNSGNKIRIYIITAECLKDLVHKYLPKKIIEKYFK